MLNKDLSNTVDHFVRQGWVELYEKLKTKDILHTTELAMFPTYLRLSTSEGYDMQRNVCLAPRFIFLAIEIARNRELHNQIGQFISIKRAEP